MSKLTQEQREYIIIKELQTIRKNMQFFFWCAMIGIFGAIASVLMIAGV